MNVPKQNLGVKPYYFFDSRWQKHILISSEMVFMGYSQGHILWEDPSISDPHCYVKWESYSQKAVVTDLNSHTGIKINGQSVLKGFLKPEDTLEIGNQKIIFKDPALAEEKISDSLWKTSESLEYPKIYNAQMNIIKKYKIYLRAILSNGTVYEKLLPTPYIIGRESFLSGDEGISRKHAQVSIDHLGRLMIEDLKSTNGTWILDKKCINPTLLETYDPIKVGNTLIYLSAQPPQSISY